MRIDSCSSPRPTTFKAVGLSSVVLDPKRHVADQFAIETLLQLPRGRRTGPRARPWATCSRRRSSRPSVRPPPIGGRAIGFSAVATVSPMVMSSMPARHTMSPAPASVDVDTLQAVEGKQLGHPRLHLVALEAADHDVVADLDAPVEDAADGDAAEVVARSRGSQSASAAGRPGLRSGGGIDSTMASKSGRRSSPRIARDPVLAALRARSCRARGSRAGLRAASRSMKRS